MGRDAFTYGSFSAMKARCYDKNHQAYPYYGGAGIAVCERWLGAGGFARFLEDMGPRPAGHTLDRVEGAHGYSPANCRWATKEEQANNKRDNVVLRLDGLSMTVAQWARRLEMTEATIRLRLRKGATPEVALNKDTDVFVGGGSRKDHSPNRAFSMEQVASIRKASGTHTSVAKQYGVSETCIARIRNGATYRTFTDSAQCAVIDIKGE